MFKTDAHLGEATFIQTRAEASQLAVASPHLKVHFHSTLTR